MKKLLMLCLSLFLVSWTFHLSAMKSGENTPAVSEDEDEVSSFEKTVKKKKSKIKERDIEKGIPEGGSDTKEKEKDHESIGCCTLLSHPISIPDLTDAEYLSYLNTSHNSWKIVGHIFEATENILDVVAYGSALLYSTLPQEGQTALTYTIVGVGIAKLICIRLVSVAQTTVKDRAVEIGSIESAKRTQDAIGNLSSQKQ